MVRSSSPGQRVHSSKQRRWGIEINTTSTSDIHCEDVSSPLHVELDLSEGHDKYSQFFYRPHFLLALGMGTIGLYWAAFHTSGDNFHQNVKRGIAGVSAAFLLYCSLPTPVPNSVFRRPHPIFWRLVTGASIIYFMSLIFLLFQTVHDGRWLVTHIDPCRNQVVSCAPVAVIGNDFGVTRALPEKDYAAHCELYTGGPSCKFWADLEAGEEACFLHLQSALEDEFVVAHFLGWLGKALIFRHAGVAWLNSIVFEFVEMSFEHWMPNFAECWWDHWVMDVLTCNLAGIIVGHLVMRYLNMKQYRWMNVSDIPTVRDKVVRVIQQFSPETWDTFRWHALESPKRWCVVVLVYVCVLVVDFNAFALKYILWIPPRNPLNVYRLLLWWLIGMVAVRELYEYSTNKAVKRLGHHAWLAWMIMITECLVWLKFGWAAGEWAQPFPFKIKLGWGLFLAAFVSWSLHHFVLVPLRQKHLALPLPPPSSSSSSSSASASKRKKI
jgi:phosphatidylserine synthase 2